MAEVFAPQTPEDDRQVVRSFNEDGSANFGQVGVEEISYKGRFGAVARSTTENEISIGEKYFTLDIDDGKIRTGDDVLINSLDDFDCYMWGEVVGTDTVAEPLRIRVFVDDISAITNTSTNWEIQVVARPKPGIEKDISTSSIDPTTGGPWTFTVTAGKFFPVGGTLLIKPTTDRTIAVIGEVKAYDDTDLTVSLRSTNATVSQSYDSWSIALLDSPPADLPFLSIVGLKVSRTSAARSLDISAGSIMDSTGKVLLTLQSPITKLMTATFAVGDGEGGIIQTAALAGTVTSTGDDLAGSGTTFTTDFDAAGAPTDFVAQGGADTYSTNIAIASATDGIERIDSDTDIEGWITLGASSSAYYRNGPITTSGSILSYFVVVMRRDTDGQIDVGITSWSPSTGEPDLPPGFSSYRVIAAVLYTVSTSAAVDSYVFEQPLYERQPLISINAPVLLWTSDTSIPGAKTITGSGDVSQNTLTSTIELNVGNNRITNAKLDDMQAYRLKGRNAGTTGDPSDISIAALTEKTTLADDDLFLIQDSEASNAFKKVKKSNVGGGITMGKAIAAAIVFG